MQSCRLMAAREAHRGHKQEYSPPWRPERRDSVRPCIAGRLAGRQTDPENVGHIEHHALIHVLESRFSIDETRFRANILIEIRFVDQIPNSLDVRIATLFEVTAQHVFGLSGIGRRSQAPDRRPSGDERWIKEHVYQQRDVVGGWFPAGIHREEIRKLFSEHPVAIDRSESVDAALKQRSFRPWIDDRGSQSTQIVDGPLREFDAFTIRLVEQFLIHVLSNDADPYSAQCPLVRKASIGL